MVTIRQYLKAETLEEAWKANQKRSGRIVGGMGWMKMSSANVDTAIDLSGLDLNRIEETDDEFIIGAMVTLRQFETNEGFNRYFDNAAKESVRHIVGVAFRNCATIGGSAWLRPGFSDPLTLFLALDTAAEIYTGQDRTVLIPLPEFCAMKKDNSILTALHVRKDGRKVTYQSFRNTETDFPVLTAAISRTEKGYTAAVGARPSLACQIEGRDEQELAEKAKELSYQSNIRASAGYRRMLSGVLIGRAMKKLEEEAGEE